MVIVPHPFYLPDLVPCDFALLPKLKMRLESIKENDFHGAFKVWKKQWDYCIHSQGDYFEGDGRQNSVS
jgi:hypothetical protein